MSPIDYWRVIRRWSVLLIVGTLLAALVAAGIVVRSRSAAHPGYGGTATVQPTATSPAVPTPTARRGPPKGSFHVQGNIIKDPRGRVFKIKGLDMVYGRFAGGDANGYGLTNYNNARRDLQAMKNYGINLVRVAVSHDAAYLPPGDPNYIGGYIVYMQELDKVVAWATQRGLVVELSQALTKNFTDALYFDEMLAERYKNNPYVWIEPSNEPNCETGNGNPNACHDWTTWQNEEQHYVTGIRKAGNTAPIVINGVDWSEDLSQIGTYPLHDPLGALIYGAHRYNNGEQTFDRADQERCDRKWAELSATYPIIVDEVGVYNGYAISLTWNQGFMNYATDWVLHRQGAGVIGFTGHWSNANEMYDAMGHWTPWGGIFYNSYLLKMSRGQ